MPSLSAETLTLLLLVEGSAVALLAALVLTQRSRLRALHQTYARLLAGGPSGEDILGALDRHLAGVEHLSARTEEMGRELARLRQRVSLMVQAPVVTRYDAFSESGGRLSFSAALVNEAGDGLVLTGINGRMETRIYAKQLQGGESAHNLSEEERTTIAQAMGTTPVVRSTA